MPPVPNAVDFLNPRVWTGFVRDLPIPMEYIGYTYLPSRDVPTDKLQWDLLKASAELAPFVSVNAESPRMGPEIITQAWADVCYVRYKRTYNESDLRIIRDFGMAPQYTLAADMRTAAESRMARDIVRLNDAIDGRIEWMQINSLLGQFSAVPDARSQIKFTVTYPVGQVTPSVLWSDVVNSDPLNDIQTWYLNMRFAPKVAIMSRQTFYNLARNQHFIRQWGFNTGQAISPTLMVPGSVQSFFSMMLGIDIVVYNTMYTTFTDSGGSTASNPLTLMLPANKVIFMPSEQVGYTATAPAVQNNYASGKFAWTRDPAADGSARDPWQYEVGAGWYGLPVIEKPERIFVATVA